MIDISALILFMGPLMRRKNLGEGALKLEDGSEFKGFFFGAKRAVSGEVVFNTGMVGYLESLTDPSYRGQILCLTYPLIGNYGVPRRSSNEFDPLFESSRIQISGLIVSEICEDYSHWSAVSSLSGLLEEAGIPGIEGIDTRLLTKILRENGTLLGKIVADGEDTAMFNPSSHNLVADVSIDKVREYGDDGKRVVVVDCGLKNGIVNSLIRRRVRVIRVPWNYDFTAIDYDGLCITNGPGDPMMCVETIANLKKAIVRKRPIFGICLGNQLLSLAAGARTYKLKYGHRSQNQPCSEADTGRCFITSQNHGYAVDEQTLPAGWRIWFRNANDRTVEGVRHESLPFMSVQFHPEARPGPTDTDYLFDEFVKLL